MSDAKGKALKNKMSVLSGHVEKSVNKSDYLQLGEILAGG